ncbi:MAG: hypothetical protein KDN18_19405 [Verrucomicrobiae bacterium]|nr:hypothetical protein [Verrucomicrobiae bacterium]
MTNGLLTRLDPRKRRQIRVAPWLWEVLRRHPDFEFILMAYRSQVGPYPDPARQESASAASAFEAWLHARRNFLKKWEGRGEVLMGVLVEYAHLTWEDLHPTSPHQACQAKEPGRSCEFDAVPHRFREAARLNFEMGLKEFLSNALNYVNDEKLIPDTAVFVPGLPPEEVASRIFYRNRDDWGTKALDDYTLGDFKNAAHSRARKLLILEYDEGASVEVLTEDIRQHLKTQKSNGWGSSERPARSSWRLTPESLERLSLLDMDCPTSGNSRISTKGLKAILKDFSRFNLKLNDSIQ